MSLEGQIAVVTGAAQGLGLGIAETLARTGATVIICRSATRESGGRRQDVHGRWIESFRRSPGRDSDHRGECVFRPG